MGDKANWASLGPISGKDLLRSTQTGVVEGASRVLGATGDFQAGGRNVAQGVADLLAQYGLGNGTVAQGIPGVPTGGQIFQILSTAAAKKVGADPRLARLAAATMIPGAMSQAPTSQEIQGAATHDNPLYQPQTKPGKYARTIAQFALASAIPGVSVR